MKKLSQILTYLEQGKISSDHAEKQVLDLFAVSGSLPSKEQIKKALYECAITTQTDEGVKMERIFDKEVNAILKLLTGNEC